MTSTKSTIHQFYSACVLAIALYGCNSPNSDSQLDNGMSQTRTALEAVHTDRGLTGRTSMRLGKSEVILLHYPMQESPGSDLSVALGSTTPSKDDDGSVVNDVDDRWCAAANECLTSFNCCAHAVGDDLGLTPRDWVEPIATQHTQMTNPMQLILDSCYRLVKEQKTEPAGVAAACQAISSDPDVLENDVVCFYRESSPPVGFVHVGKVEKKDGKNWLVSKMGTGPILLTTIENAAAHFNFVKFDAVLVYRFADHGS